MTPLLELKDIRRSYPAGDEQVEVLKGISLDIYAGEMVAIVGADTNTVNHHISLKRFPTLQRQFYFFTIDHMFNGIIEQNAHTSLLVAL